jgi:hypothetical protein
MLEEGVYTSVSEIGDAENISKSYVSRILRLAMLAPDIIDAVLAGRTDQGVMLEQLEPPLPASWSDQWKALQGVAGDDRGDPTRCQVAHLFLVRGGGGISGTVLRFGWIDAR